MKKIILFILTIGFSQSMKALEIENIAISTVSDQAINIHVNTMDLYLYTYNSFQYNIVGNTISLEICYHPGIGAAISYLEHDFQIPVNTTTAVTYLLTVKVYYVNLQNFTCDYQIVRDIENLSFVTPLIGTVYLTTNSVNQKKVYSILYPNPTKGILFLNEKIKTDKIELYDNLGRFIEKKDGIENEIDLNDLADGIYFFRIEVENQVFIEKIILKK